MHFSKKKERNGKIFLFCLTSLLQNGVKIGTGVKIGKNPLPITDNGFLDHHQSLFFPFRTLCGGFLYLLGTVPATCLLSTIYSGGVKRSTNDLITHARQVSNSSTANQHNGVLLQRMSLTGNVHSNFLSIGKSYPCDFSECGIRLLGGHCTHQETHATFLRTLVQHGGFALVNLLYPVLPNQLIDRRHILLSTKRWEFYPMSRFCQRGLYPTGNVCQSAILYLAANWSFRKPLLPLHVPV